MITEYKITEIFCAVDEFCKEFDKQIDKKSLMSSEGKVHAAKEMHYRDHQRHAQEHGTAGTLKAQVNQQLHHEHDFGIGGILLLCQQTTGIGKILHRRQQATHVVLGILIPNWRTNLL